MALVGVSLELLALFVGFGLLVGILFGFFGMGGSFLVTPALLSLGYPSRVAVGSGLAYVFGTAAVATLKHADLGQVDLRLGAVMVVGTVGGIEVGKEALLSLEAVGLAGSAVSVAYVVLLAAVGGFVTRQSLRASGPPGPAGDGGRTAPGTDGAADDDHGPGRSAPVPKTVARASETIDGSPGPGLPGIAWRLRAVRLPPMVELRGAGAVSLWAILGVGFATGLLSGFLGVGGGFLRLPALTYLLGVPVPIAVGTDLFEIVVSGGVGSLRYAMIDGVDLAVVLPLLAGGTVGARIGSTATTVVDEREIMHYFGLLLLAGAVAVGAGAIGRSVASPALETAGLAVLVGSALLVSTAIVRRSVAARRAAGDGEPVTGTRRER